MRFSYSAIWEDTVRLLRAHASLAAALAGVFLFLPSLLTSHFLPFPTPSDPADVTRQFSEYFSTNAHWIALSGIIGMVGTLSILFLVFRTPGIAVGGAIAAGFALLPFYFIANFLTVIPIVIGLMLFIIPGLYLIGRFLPLAPVMVAQGERNPLTAIARTWALTRGRGWAVTGLFILVCIGGFVLSSVISGIIVVILRVALPENISTLLGLIVSAAASTILQMVLIFLYAAIYRALSVRHEASAQAPPTSGI
ncbi:MAG TPA: glycerophosphoryl diester phosphodiesterase membrane domain-containing protein [Allosphingosinicella sp.]